MSATKDQELVPEQHDFDVRGELGPSTPNEQPQNSQRSPLTCTRAREPLRRNNHRSRDQTGTATANRPESAATVTTVLRADDGTRTHDLLHGKDWRAFALVRSRSLNRHHHAACHQASERPRTRTHQERSHCNHAQTPNPEPTSLPATPWRFGAENSVLGFSSRCA
jgi:hypothetical protein